MQGVVIVDAVALKQSVLQQMLTDLHALEASKTKWTENLSGLSAKGTSFRVFFFKLTAFRIVAVCVSSCGGGPG